MRAAGMVLFLLGFLGGAFFIVQQAKTVTWSSYGMAVGVAIVGVILMRIAAAQQTTDEAEVHASLQRVVESLERVVERVTALNAERESLGVYGVHARIDEDVMAHVNAFVEVRETLIAVYGLELYARTMDTFAAGERSLNRAWSASADGYIDEVWDCLERAERKMSGALEVVRTAKA